ncbi:polysaccharide pyruvyl transferase family protein [Bacillus sp. B1-b2]|uniref:polysaccharide pyruvyl transferase family protein n=1 Tax=Bacillus sp. B1-b2 TaxID=2653201 RepID=UPI001261B2B6|nr:polysaccharide pyruvyl transferase family protein [Bacillus sp. B1-b2]KAB7670736.1 general stress protein [Bacillus sp. B1-b2]
MLSQSTTLTKGIAPNVSREALTNNKPKVFLFGSPSYTNIGDQAIAYAIEKLIKNCFPYYEYIEIMDYATVEGIEIVKQIIKQDDIVCFTGGGNLGSLYVDIEEDRRRVIEEFKDYRTIVFPQSAFFEDTEHGRSEEEKSQRAYNQNKHLTLVAREHQTLKRLRETFQANVLYTPDLVLSLQIEPRNLEREGVMFVLREDKEKITEENFVSKLTDILSGNYSVERTDTVLSEIDTIDYADREQNLLKMLDKIGSKKLIITDRLHAMIFSILTKTPCLVFGNSYGKAKHSYEDWLQELNFIEYTDSKDVEHIQVMIDRLLEAEPNRINLTEDFQVLKDYFTQ